MLSIRTTVSYVYYTRVLVQYHNTAYIIHVRIDHPHAHCAIPYMYNTCTCIRYILLPAVMYMFMCVFSDAGASTAGPMATGPQLMLVINIIQCVCTNCGRTHNCKRLLHVV